MRCGLLSNFCHHLFNFSNTPVAQLWEQWRHQDLVPGGAHAKVTGFLQEATVDVVAVRLCVGQSALKKLIVVSRGGHVPQCPIAGDVNV